MAAGGERDGFVWASQLTTIDEHSHQPESAIETPQTSAKDQSEAAWSSLEDRMKRFSLEDVQRRHFGCEGGETSVVAGRQLLEKLGIPSVDAASIVEEMGQRGEVPEGWMDSLANSCQEKLWKSYYGVPDEPVERDEVKGILRSLGLDWNDLEALENKHRR